MNQDGVGKRRVTKYDPIAVGEQSTVVWGCPQIVDT